MTWLTWILLIVVAVLIAMLVGVTNFAGEILDGVTRGALSAAGRMEADRAAKRRIVYELVVLVVVLAFALGRWAG